MKSATAVFCLSLLLCAHVNVAAESGSHTEFVLPIKLYGHLIVVQGGLGNIPDRNLLIDTGAYPSAIDSSIAHKLKLKVNPGQTLSLGQKLHAGAAIIPQIDIGPVQAKGHPVVVEDLSALGREIGTRVDALIGLDVLARANFRIDYKSKEMTFGPPDTLPFSTPIEARRAMACVGLNVDGRVVHLLLDTGAAKTVLFAHAAPWLSPNESSEQRFRALGGLLRLTGVHAHQLDLGGVPIARDDVYISDMKMMRVFPFDGVMATRGAHFSQIAFDFDHNIFSWQMEATPASLPQPAPVDLSIAAQTQSTRDPMPVSGGSGEDTRPQALRAPSADSY